MYEKASVGFTKGESAQKTPTVGAPSLKCMPLCLSQQGKQHGESSLCGSSLLLQGSVFLGTPASHVSFTHSVEDRGEV